MAHGLVAHATVREGKNHRLAADATRGIQSAIRNPQSAIGNQQSAIPSPPPPVQGRKLLIGWQPMPRGERALFWGCWAGEELVEEQAEACTPNLYFELVLRARDANLFLLRFGGLMDQAAQRVRRSLAFWGS